jgi:FMN phosphatase YigB (HAD superfamily)
MTFPGKERKPTLKGLLFDLDGTLLDVRMSLFLESYFPLLAGRFGVGEDLPRFREALIGSVRMMMDNRDGNRILSRVFLESFSPKVGMSEERVTRIFRGFHREGIDSLRPLTRAVRQARPLLDRALELGYDIALATNPVFFREAIDARLRWAGLKGVPFPFVSSAENMHFCKPHPEYFNEVLDGIGREPAECMMIGDDPHMDMSAGEVGLATWFVPSAERSVPPAHADYAGSLEDLAVWLERPTAPTPLL